MGKKRGAISCQKFRDRREYESIGSQNTNSSWKRQKGEKKFEVVFTSDAQKFIFAVKGESIYVKV